MLSSIDANVARQLISNIKIDEVMDACVINLCAYDNVLSNTAASFLNTPLGSRYRIGTFRPEATNHEQNKSELILRQFPALNALEQSAHHACLSMFGGVRVDLRPLSGVHATLCIILSLTNPGDVIYSIDPKYAGHFATRHLIERAGRICKYLAWDKETHHLALNEIKNQFRASSPKFILLDHSAPLVPIDTKALRQLAGSKAIIDFDASHSMGLIAGGLFQNPLEEGCDILHGNTHKSFPGPQKALIVFNNEDVAKCVQTNFDAELVSSQHTHHLIALCVTLLEMHQWGKAYADQLIKNATALEDTLRTHGFELHMPARKKVKSHIILIKTPGQEKGYNWFERLCQACIITNVRPIFDKTIMRLGVQEVTRRGFIEQDMIQLGKLISAAVFDPLSEIKHIASRATKLRTSKTEIKFSFDNNNGLKPFSSCQNMIEKTVKTLSN